MIIKSDERNRGKWKVRAVRLRPGKSYLESQVQHLFPLELSCDADETQTALNVDALHLRPNELHHKWQKNESERLQKWKNSELC